MLIAGRNLRLRGVSENTNEESAERNDEGEGEVCMNRTDRQTEAGDEIACSKEGGGDPDEKQAMRDKNGGTEGIYVLHVDDSAEFVEVASTYLQKSNDSLKIETATDPVEALRLVDEEDFDCIISDCSMPDTEMDGIDLCEAVRSEHPDLPFVFFTGTPFSEFPRRVMANEDTGHMTKEINVTQFSKMANWITETV